MADVVQLQNVSVSINHTEIVHDISLGIPEGKITAIIGPNGCGKSTTLKAISRILPCTQGTITLNGREIHQYAHRAFAQELAMLPQSPKAPSDLTVIDLVNMGRFPYKNLFNRAQQEDREIVMWALEQTNMRSMHHRLLSTLSGGERQRAWIAMTLAQKPRVLMLDEPTTYLDISHQLEVMKLLVKLNTELHLTVVLVLHELNQALQFADNVAVIKAGRLVVQGDPRQVITPELLAQVFGVRAERFACSNGMQVLIPIDLL